MYKNRHILEKKKEELQRHILAMAENTSNSIHQAIECMKGLDKSRAETIVGNDKEINRQHRHTETMAVSIIASQQPVAHDLREIVAAMRVSDEIERIADHASNVAGIRLELNGQDMSRLGLEEMADFHDRVENLFQVAMQAYQSMDVEQARQTEALEEEVDALIQPISTSLFARMKADPDVVEDASRMLWINHNLERIADRATNIAEQVIYMVTAEEEKLN
jgi:phosphate transport system protein